MFGDGGMKTFCFVTAYRAWVMPAEPQGHEVGSCEWVSERVSVCPCVRRERFSNLTAWSSMCVRVGTSVEGVSVVKSVWCVGGACVCFHVGRDVHTGKYCFLCAVVTCTVPSLFDLLSPRFISSRNRLSYYFQKWVFLPFFLRLKALLPTPILRR